MKVQLPYGMTRLTVEVPEDATVLRSQEMPALADERVAFLAALRAPLESAPLAQRVQASDSVAIVISDITRPTPNERIVPWLLEELSFVPRSQIVIINGTGSHRANTREELVQMLGEEVVETVTIVNHDAFAQETLALVGETAQGVPVWMNRRCVEADFRTSSRAFQGVQKQALVQLQANVYLYSSLPPDVVRSAKLIPSANLQATIDEVLQIYTPAARIAVLPEGPLMVPWVANMVEIAG